ncbi:MAG: hypothetical protein NC328_02055 [Muribaculum sp.]|nr:hypothetical protein [Muribaculum sp.]
MPRILIILSLYALCLGMPGHTFADADNEANYKDSIKIIKKEIRSLNNGLNPLLLKNDDLSEQWVDLHSRLRTDSINEARKVHSLREKVADLSADINNPSELNKRYAKAIHAENIARIETTIDRTDLSRPLTELNADSLMLLQSAIQLESQPSKKMKEFNTKISGVLEDIKFMNRLRALYESPLEAAECKKAISTIEKRYNSWSKSRQEEMHAKGVALANYLKAWKLFYDFTLKVSDQENKNHVKYTEGLKGSDPEFKAAQESMEVLFGEFESSKAGIFTSGHPYLGPKLKEYHKHVVNNPLTVTPTEEEFIETLKSRLP